MNSSLVYLSEEESTWFHGFTPLAMFLGVQMSIVTSELLGRKRLVQVSNVVSIVGYAILYVSNSFIFLAIGRIIQCIGT